MLLARLITASILASLVFATMDIARLGDGASEDASELLSPMALLCAYHLALGAALGAGLWGLVRGWSLVLNRVRRPRLAQLVSAAIITAATAPAWLAFVRYLLSGDRISQHDRIELFRLGAPVVLAFACIVGLAFLGTVIRAGHGLATRRRPGLALLLAIGAAGVAAGWTWWDMTQRRGSYGPVHDAAAGVAFVALTGALALATIALAPTPRAGVLSWSAVGLGVLGVFVVAVRPPDGFERSLWRRFCARGQKVLRLHDAVTGTTAPKLADVAADDAFRRARGDRTRVTDGVREELAAQSPGRDQWNLVWITIDTIRADHLHCYGYEKETSPHLDALARQGTLFEKNYAQNPITHFSFQSMFYGRYPTATPKFRYDHHLPDDAEGSITLATLLTQRGFVTGSVPAIPPASLRHPTYEVLARGFTHVNPGRTGPNLDAQTQTRIARSFLQAHARERFFLWLHYMDPHAPYLFHRDHDLGTSQIGRYDGEIAKVDAHVAKVLAKLDDLGLADRTIVVVNGDHGEALGDHNTDYHGSTLYEEQIHVPLIVRVPGLAARRVATPVENVDLAPTLLDLLAVDHAMPYQGDSLVGFLLHGDAWPDKPAGIVVSEIPDAMVGALSPEAMDQVAVRDGRWKLILRRGTGETELYDLDADPRELQDLAHVRGDIVRRLRGRLKVIEDESRTINVSSRAVASLADVLREDLGKLDSPHARVRRIAVAVRADIPGLVDVIRELLDGGKEVPDVLAYLLHHIGGRLGADAVGHLRAGLRDRFGWGVPMGAMAGLRRLPDGERAAAYVALREDLVALATGPPAVAREAALILAEGGFDDGRTVLERDLRGSDRRAAFDAACGLALLGQADAEGRIVRDLDLHRRDPVRSRRALEALTKLGDKGALERVTELVKDVYLHHEIKRAATRYLDTIGGELTVPAFVFLLQGWDPAVSKVVAETVKRRFGEARVDALREAARFASSAQELLDQGQAAPAVDGFLKADRAAGAGGALFRIYAARAAWRGGDKRRAANLARSVLDDAKLAAWHAAARPLGQDVVQPPRLEVLEVRPLHRRPVGPTATLMVAIVLKNIGSRPAPGGQWPGGVQVTLSWTAGGKNVSANTYRRWLPDSGLKPGEEIVLVCQSQVPAEAIAYELAAKVRRTHGGVLVSGLDRRASVITGGFGGHEIDPTDVTFRGESLLRQWIPHPFFADGVVEKDGSVSFVARGTDTNVLGPALRDLGRPLEVTLVYEAIVPPARKGVVLECYYVYEGGGRFDEPVAQRALVQTNEIKTLKTVLEPHDGRGARRIRLDFGQRADYFRVLEVKIRVL